MENAENGASQLTLSTDVNENTETGISLTGLTIDVSERNVGGDKGVYKSYSEGKKDSDEGKAEYATDRGAGGLHGGEECGGTGSTMLGFVAKSTSGGAKNNCVTSDRHIDSSLNRVTESARQPMVESTTGGRGTSAGSPSGVADVADCQTDTDEAHPRDFSGTVGKPKCSTVWDMQKDTLNSNQELYSTSHLSPTCDGHEHQQICRCQASQPEPLTLRNGNMNGTGQLPPVSDSGSQSQRELIEKVGNVKMANGEVMSTENREGLEASAQCRLTEAWLSNPLVENPSSHSVPQSSRTERRASEPRTGESLKEDSDVFGDSYASPSRQIHGDDTVPRVELPLRSDTETTVRPQSLRSITHSTHFLSCDSTPLSPEKSNAFLRPGAEQDLNFMDVNLNSRNTFEISRRQSAPDNMPGVTSVSSAVASDQMSKQKKHGISDFFGRGLFSKKQCEPHSAPGWKLFGKVPPRENSPKDSRTIQQDSNQGSLTSVSTPSLLGPAEYEAKRAQSGHSPPSQAAHSGTGRRKNLEFEPLSTTALILEDRPANLPAKSTEEAQRHRQEYDEMVAEAKKRELKEAQRKKKMMKERFKQEESIASAMVAWNNEILPNWESMRGTRRVRELWWQGLPPNVRGKVWSLAVGNELNITPELYEIFLSRARERWRSFSETGSETETEAESGASLADRESSLDVIKLDISRTFPSLFIFQKGGPYHDVLHSILGAYTCYRPDVGYVQGMSFIAAVLILNLEEPDAFIAFANLLNKPCQMAFFRVDHELMMKYFAAFEVFFEENLPRLFSHFKSCSLTPDLYLIDWIFTLYSRPLPLDVACRVWDVFCRDGEEFLFRTGLGILRLFEDVLLQMDFIHMAQFLTRLPDDLPSDALFSCIAATQMLSGNRKWAQVFNALMKDSKDAEKTSSPALKCS